jgi:predicted  nucleic acid-binding Zn-ribbon protein
MALLLTYCYIVSKGGTIMKNKVQLVQQGYCPNCGKNNLDYSPIEIDGQSLCYPFRCEDCDHEGEEWYNLEFTSYVYYPKGQFTELEPGMPLIKQGKSKTKGGK